LIGIWRRPVAEKEARSFRLQEHNEREADGVVA